MTRLATPTTETESAVASAPRLFSISMLASGIRCALTYVLLPFFLPILGLAPGVGPALGIVVGLVAIAANGVSIRRFWRFNHPWRKPVTAIHITVIALMVVLVVLDVRALVA